MKVAVKKRLATLLCAAVLAPGVAWAGQWQGQTVAEMPTQLYVPTSAPKLAGKRALMISLGGCGQQAPDNTEFRDQSNWPATAEDYGMVVAVPNAPGGGVLAYGCWDYYGDNHTRSQRHNDNILALVDALLARKSLNIDPDQVYLSGLSSGGGMVNVLLCLAPEVFAGGGNAAGPALGTSAWQTTKVATNSAEVAQTCGELAGDKGSFFASQVVSLVWGEKDVIANPGYAAVTAAAFASLYGAEQQGDAESTVDGAAVSRSQWGDEQGVRVRTTVIAGLGHAWPAGGGSGGSRFMAADTLNYPAQLTEFLFSNNRRVAKSANSTKSPGLESE